MTLAQENKRKRTLGRVDRGGYPPRPPTDLYVPSRAYGSSYHGFVSRSLAAVFTST